MSAGHRPALHHVVQDRTGIVQGAKAVLVCKEDGTTLLDQPMYADAYGETLLPNPLIADGSGAIEAYAKYAEDVVLVVDGLPFRSRFGEDHAGPRPHFDVTANGIRPEHAAAENTARWLELETAVADGDTIYFPNAGVYQFNDELTIASKSRIKITGAGQTVIQQVGTRRAGLVLSNCPDAVIRDLRFRGPDGTPQNEVYDESAIRIEDGARCTITDCHIEPNWAQAGICCVVGDHLIIDRCRIEGKPGPVGVRVDGHNGILVYAARSTITNNDVSGFWVNISTVGAGGYVGHVITGNRCKDAGDVNIYVGTCIGGLVSDNVCEGTGSGIKIGYAASAAVVRGNTLVGGSNNIWANHVYGLVIEGNTIDGSNITMNVDNSDGEQSAKSCSIVGNTIRNSSYQTTDAAFIGAITARGRNIIIADNLIEWPQQHGISFYAADGSPLTGNVIRDNTIRMASQYDDADFDGVKLGGFSEDLTGCRIIGNTITSRLRPTGITGTVVAGRDYVSDLLLTPPGLKTPALAALEPGDTIAASGLAPGTKITSLSTLGTGQASIAPEAVGAATNTSIAITSPRMRYGIHVGSGGVVEIWGNEIVGAQQDIKVTFGMLRTLDQNLKVEEVAYEPYGAPRLERVDSLVGTPTALQRHTVVLGGVSRQIRVHVLDTVYTEGAILLELFAADASAQTSQYYRGVVTTSLTTPTKTDLDAAASNGGCFVVGAPTWNAGGLYWAIPITRSSGWCQGYVTIFGPTWTQQAMVRVV